MYPVVPVLVSTFSQLLPDVLTTRIISPRFSISWDPWADGKTKTFGSWGRFYDRLFLDSVTGERLAAGLDQRAGTKDPKNMLNKWADVESAFREWAESLRAKLEKVRGA